jgi:hypothetical protein
MKLLAVSLLALLASATAGTNAPAPLNSWGCDNVQQQKKANDCRAACKVTSDESRAACRDTYKSCTKSCASGDKDCRKQCRPAFKSCLAPLPDKLEACAHQCVLDNGCKFH